MVVNIKRFFMVTVSYNKQQKNNEHNKNMKYNVNTVEVFMQMNKLMKMTL